MVRWSLSLVLLPLAPPPTNPPTPLIASWPKTLASLLPPSRPYLDAVIDSGGGPIANQVTRLLKHGGVIACYGSTSGVDVQIGMGFVLKNLEFKGESRRRSACAKEGVTRG
jgi:NADPH:quinone reductase-like Zn-dependent oxidoreductase